MDNQKSSQPSPAVARARAVMEACTDKFSIFVEEILGLSNEKFHDQLDDDISQDFQSEDPLEQFFACITMPRDHGKSKHLSVAYPLWRMAKNHNVRILSISRTAGVAQSFLSEIVTTIERNDRYATWSRFIDPDHVGVVPRLKKMRKQTEDWSGQSITIERNDQGLKDPTIAATGLFGQILSRRADIIILDDVVDQQNSATENQRRKVKEWIETTVIPVLVPGGTLIYLGNTWHHDDVVSQFLKDPRFQVTKRLGAVVHEAERQDLWQEWASIRTNISVDPRFRIATARDFYEQNRAEMDRGWETLWPARYPYSALYLRRLLNPYVFARMYQCDPSDRPDQKIKDEWIERALERGRGLRFQDQPHGRNVLLTSAGGMDLAISQEESADDTSLAYMDVVKYGYDGVNDGDYIVRQIHRGAFTPSQQREAARKAWAQDGLQSIRVESNSYQMALAIDLREQSVPVTSYHTGKEKFDPAVGINAFAVQLENGKVVIPSDPSDPRTLTLSTQLANEMRAFTGDNTEHTGDGLMSVWFAYSECVSLLGTRLYHGPMVAEIKDSPPTATAEQRAPLEKQADDWARREQEQERARLSREMAELMRGGGRR